MILKEKIFSEQVDRRLAAGDAAEKQMAFYMKRAFGSASDVWVINDLRIEHEGEVAQMDHLLVSQRGLFIVESKSFTGSVHINAHGEWARQYENSKQGIASPVLQADAQGQLLKKMLKANKDKLLGTLVGLQKGFSYCPVLVYVAISDGGIIHRDMDLPQVMKADAVAPAIKAWLESCSVLKGLLSLSLEVKPGEWVMSKKEAETVALFLATRHTPRVTTEIIKNEKSKAAVVIPTRIEPMQEGHVCPECGQQKLIKKSISRSDATPRIFLACAGYPKSCKGIYPLPAESNANAAAVSLSVSAKANCAAEAVTTYMAGNACPRCKDGKLVQRKAKTAFLGCSSYPDCKFTDYRN